MKRTLIILFALLLALPVCVQAEEEFSYHSIVPTPHVTLITPQAGQSYDAGGIDRGDGFALVQHGYAVGHGQHLIQLMGDDNDGMTFAAHLAQNFK